jgi:hypothetical protein
MTYRQALPMECDRGMTGAEPSRGDGTVTDKGSAVSVPRLSWAQTGPAVPSGRRNDGADRAYHMTRQSTGVVRQPMQSLTPERSDSDRTNVWLPGNTTHDGANGQVSRHMTDGGNIDLNLIVYESENATDVMASITGALAEKIKRLGAEIFSPLDAA